MTILFFYTLDFNTRRGGVEIVSNVLRREFAKKDVTVYYLSWYRSIIHAYLPNQKKCDCRENRLFLEHFIREKSIDIILNQAALDIESSKLILNLNVPSVKIISVFHNSLLARANNFVISNRVFRKYSKIRICRYLYSRNFFLFLVLFLYKLKYTSHYKRVNDRSDAIVFLSPSFFQEFYFFYKYADSSKLRAISNPLAFDYPINVIGEKKKQLLYVGRINVFSKRVDLLLEIWKEVVGLYPDWSLKIVGDGEEKATVMKLAENMKLRNVYFEGYQNPIKYYEEAAIFCMTSAYEGFGMVLIEAMAYKTVPIAFNSFLSVTDIIVHNSNGILVKPFDKNEYVNEICKLIEDSSYREKLSREAQRSVKRFASDEIINDWFSLFANVIGND